MELLDIAARLKADGAKWPLLGAHLVLAAAEREEKAKDRK